MANDFSWDTNCVGLWRFEADPGLAVDSMTLQPNLTAQASPNADTDYYAEGARSCYFNVAGSEAYYIPDSGENDISDDFPGKGGTTNTTFSIGAWLRIESFNTTGAVHTIIGKWDSTNTNMTFRIYLYADSDTSYDLRVGLGYNSGTQSTIVVADTTTALALETWYHVVFTHNGSTGAWTYRCATAAAETHSTSGTFESGLSPDSAVFSIGAFSNGTTLLGTMRGWLDEVFVTKDVLSSAEVLAIWGGSYAEPPASSGTLAAFTI